MQEGWTSLVKPVRGWLTAEARYLSGEEIPRKNRSQNLLA